MDTIGILAYGSLIEDPGQEILNLIIRRINTETPFLVEFARLSQTRGNAPTLIPFAHGQRVKAQILVLQPNTTIQQASNILYHRETRQSARIYVRPVERRITEKTVLIDILSNFEEVLNVLFTRIGSNLINVTSQILAENAIRSARGEAGANSTDGISYLMSAKRNGIKTTLSDDYESQILRLTNAGNLEEALEFCRNNNQ